MKYIALIPGILLFALAASSCCSSIAGGTLFSCNRQTVQVEQTEWVEEEVYVDHGAKGGKGGTTTVRTPVVTTVDEKVKCPDCLSWYCAKPGCCGTVGEGILQRATAQGGSGEPHIGQIATMKVLSD